MTLQEPLTVLTDVLLAALCLGFFSRLSREFPGRCGGFIFFWALTFFMVALGALAGAVSHGFKPYLSEPVKFWVWKTAVFSIGLASLGMLGAGIRSAFPGAGSTGRFLMGAALLKFFVFAWVMARSDRFLFVIVDYLFSMAAVLALSVKEGIRPGNGPAWTSAGLLLSFAAAGVQQSPLFLGPLNHNDLYHVVQMAACSLLFKGVLVRAAGNKETSL